MCTIHVSLPYALRQSGEISALYIDGFTVLCGATCQVLTVSLHITDGNQPTQTVEKNIAVNNFGQWRAGFSPQDLRIIADLTCETLPASTIIQFSVRCQGSTQPPKDIKMTQVTCVDELPALPLPYCPIINVSHEVDNQRPCNNGTRTLHIQASIDDQVGLHSLDATMYLNNLDDGQSRLVDQQTGSFNRVLLQSEASGINLSPGRYRAIIDFEGEFHYCQREYNINLAPCADSTPPIEPVDDPPSANGPFGCLCCTWLWVNIILVFTVALLILLFGCTLLPVPIGVTNIAATAGVLLLVLLPVTVLSLIGFVIRCFNQANFPICAVLIATHQLLDALALLSGVISILLLWISTSCAIAGVANVIWFGIIARTSYWLARHKRCNENENPWPRLFEILF